MLKLLTALIALLTLIHKSETTCAEGCLACSQTEACTVCDTALGFVLQDAACIKHQISNCDIPKTPAICYRCKSAYYLAAEGSCVKSTVTIANCDQYSGEGQCGKCAKGYFLNANACKQVTKIVAECIDYEADGKCSRCSYSLLSSDKSTCYTPPFETDFNCAYRYFPVACNSCKAGFDSADGLYTSDLANLNIKYALLSKETYKSRTSYLNLPTCAVTSTNTVRNAICNTGLFRPEYCNVCETGKYYDEESGSCISNPAAILGINLVISSCFFINSKQECEKCFEGYYMTYSNKACIRHTTTVDNCKIMSQRKNSECFVCNNEYFLQSASYCQQRTNFSQNCKTHNFFLDECLECKTGYLLIYQNRACDLPIANCAEYDYSKNFTVCSKCDTDFFLINNQCDTVPADKLVEGCILYDMSMDCDKCTDDMSLIQNLDDDNYTCVLKTEDSVLTQCVFASFSAAAGFVCQTCNSNSALLKFTNKCVFNSILDGLNCLQADSANTCIRCKKGYYLNLLTQTCEGGFDNNCEIYTSNSGVATAENPPRCLKCVDGFYLFQNICVETLINPENGCLRFDTNDTCLLCDTGFVYKYKTSSDVTGCRSRSSLPQFMNCDSLVWNSNVVNGPNFKCANCREGAYMTLDGVCVSCANETCKFVGSNGEVALDSTGTCSVESNGSCLQYRKGVNAYVTSNLSSVSFIHKYKSLIYKNISSYKTYGNKLNYSPLYHNVFFDSASAFTSDTITHATCRLGYARSFSVDTLTAQTNDCQVYIKNCNVRSSKMLASPQRVYASCQNCFNQKAVVFTKVKIPIEKLSGVSSSLIMQNVGSYLPSTFCYDTTINSTTVAFCGLFELTLNASESLVATCLECQPGYAPTMTSGVITSCSIISNCRFSKIGNQCNFCNNNYVLNFTKTTCTVQSQSLMNCARLDGGGSCAACINGYSYNSSGTCAKSPVSTCAKWDSETCIKCSNPLEIAITYEPQTVSGLITCTSGSRILPTYCELADINNFCVKCQSGYIADFYGVCFSETSILKCLSYDIISGACIKCANNHIYDINKKRCMPVVNLRSTSTCSGSYPFAVGINDGMDFACLSDGISNCLYYDNKAFSLGKITCSKCAVSYDLATETNTSLYKCAKFKPIDNCEAHLVEASNNYTCKKCATGFFLNTEFKCEPRLPIPQCLIYHNESRFCKECNPDLYVSDGECVPRTIRLDGCLTYHLYKNQCEVFKPDYQYLYEFRSLVTGQPSTDPLLNPDGTLKNSYIIEGCIEYFNLTICKTCSETTYLSGNICVPISTAVTNCTVYSGNSTCKTCVSGYTLVDNICKEVSAKNCLVYKNESACATCPTAFPIFDETLNCIKNPSIDYCADYKNPTTCEVCNSGYYLEKGLCNPVVTAIENCTIYKSQTECQECKLGYYLWFGKCIVNPDFDPNCESFADANQKCSLCHPGYVLLNGVCVKCGQNFISCAICNPANVEQCLMCKSGYYMNKDQTCVENITYKSFTPVTTIKLETK